MAQLYSGDSAVSTLDFAPAAESRPGPVRRFQGSAQVAHGLQVLLGERLGEERQRQEREDQ